MTHSEALPAESRDIVPQQKTFLTTGRLIFLILLLAGILRLGFLDRWPLWTDEFHTLYVAQMNTLMTEGVPNDQHPPLYYLLMAAMVRVSESETWLRLPSALAGLGAVAMMWPIGRALGRPRIGLVAMALLAFLPIHIWYSREARMYGPASLMWALSIYFFIQSLRREKLIDMWGLAASLLGGIFLVYPSIALWLLQAALFFPLWYLDGRNTGRLVRWLLAQFLVILGFMAWVPYLRVQLDKEIVFNWQLGPLDFSGTLADTVQLAALGGGLLLVAYIVLLLLFAKWPAFRRFWQQHLNLWAVLLISGYILVLILGTVPRGLSIRRQLLVFLPVLVLLASWGFIHLQRRWLTAGVIILGLILSVYTVASPAYEDWRSPAVFIAAHEAPGDQLLIHPTWNDRAFFYYYEGEVIQNVTTARQVLRQRQNDLFSAGDRVWVLANNIPGLNPDTESIFDWFAAHGELEEIQPYSRAIELRAYRMRE